MFAVYGISGPIFRGTLEDLTRVRPLGRARGVHAVAPGGMEAGAGASAVAAATAAHAEAIRAYQEAIHLDLERGPLYRAAQIMQHAVTTLAADAAVAQAWRALRDQRIHQAPVLAASRLVGIVSERDLLTAINIDHDRIVESLGRRVRDVMTTPVLAAAPDTDIRRIAAVMLEHDVDGVPIVDEGEQLVGFVSRGDILRAVVTEPPLSLWR